MKRWLRRILLGLLAFIVLASIAAVFVLRSAWFRDYLRRGVIEQAERATGARVEIGAVAFDWTAMQARVDGLVLHGKEPVEDAPLLRVGSATVGFRIVSAFERKVDLRSLKVTGPQVRVIVFPDGSTNIPGAGSTGKLWSQELLNWKIAEYEVTNGVFEYDHRRTPLQIRGQNLDLQMSFDAATPSYKGRVSSDGVRVTPAGFDPIDSRIEAEFVLEQNRVQLPHVRWSSGNARAELAGVLDDMRAPHGTFSVRASSPLRDVVREFRLPIDPAGHAAFDGDLTISFGEKFDFNARGQLDAKGLRYAQDRVKIENAELRAQTEVNATSATLRNLTFRALGATVSGDATLQDWKSLHIGGTIGGVDLRRAAAMGTDHVLPWNGVAAGTFDVKTTLQQSNLMARASLAITPATQGEPVNGHIDIAYDQAQGLVALGSSSLATTSSRVELEGTLGRMLRVRARSTRLEDVQPVIEFARGAAMELPLKLNGGSIVLDGDVVGRLDDPQFQGQTSVVNGEVRGFRFDSFSANVDASRSEMRARNLTASRGHTTAAGSITITAREGDFARAGLAAELTLRNVDIAEAARELGITEPVSGTAAAAVRLSGSVERPEAIVGVDVQDPAARDEKAARLRANVRYVRDAVEVTDGILNDAVSEIRFNASYRHPADDWRSGEITFAATTPSLPVNRIEHVAALDTKVVAILSGKVEGSGRMQANVFSLTSATADTMLRQIVLDGLSVGDIALQAQTRGNDLTLTANGNVRESRVEASGAWRLEGDAPGNATVHFSRITVDSLQQLLRAPVASVEGFVEGDATVRVALQKPREVQAELRLTQVQLNPKENPAPRLGLRPEDVVLRNSDPVVLDVTADAATVRHARFTARNTQMDLTGVVPFSAETDAALSILGNVDMTILQLLRPDLQARGNATVNASIRGRWQNPTLNGQLSFADASLYLADFPNGVDNASGTILFDRRRATVQRLTAETSGGQISFGGFLEFGDALVYRLQAKARRVRVRYPQDVSTTFDADLALNGTSVASTLTGTVTLTRSAFTVTTDLGQLMAQSAQPAASGGNAEEYLKGMQLNLRIMNASTFQLETSLSTGVEADVDLRLLGSPSRPALLGTITVNRGQVQLFGNRYTLERGDIRFLNPVKIEPTLDMDLSTHARGHTVNISISGTPQRFVPNYSSDPPLQSSEIIALLAVGRDPNSTNSATATGINSAANVALGAGSNLLGEAISAQVTNRAQRFFGATRVKIDPTMTGVDNLPQARLNFEQQVSKDITLTYITNLNHTQEQIVRVQWDLNREWSAIAVRDPNGLFGIDFQFRKRFK